MFVSVLLIGVTRRDPAGDSTGGSTVNGEGFWQPA
jgi:hypothetical protein